MYLHIGGSVVIPLKSIISILCLKDHNSKINKDFLGRCDLEGKLEKLFKKEPKSCVITEEKIYLSSLSSQALIKRIRRKGKGKAWG